VPEIIFDVRIEILTLKYLYLDIHEDISEFDLHICTWPVSRISLQWRPRGQILFWIKNWNTDPKKHTFRHTWRHILEFDHICTWLASRISLQQPPRGQILFLNKELKSWP
jgi:hypothetical protein